MPQSTTPSASHRQNPPVTATSPVLYFDGVCGLCSRTVDFVMRHDARGRFRFAPLQGTTAANHLTAADVANLSSLVLTTDSGTYRKSSAVVRILWLLGSGWWWLGWLLWLVPVPLRNTGYSLVAAYRYRLFGKHETCRLPTPEERERFLP